MKNNEVSDAKCSNMHSKTNDGKNSSSKQVSGHENQDKYRFTVNPIKSNILSVDSVRGIPLKKVSFKNVNDESGARKVFDVKTNKENGEHVTRNNMDGSAKGALPIESTDGYRENRMNGTKEQEMKIRNKSSRYIKANELSLIHI